jgi:lysyl-tRNA synthetase class 2
MTNVMASDLIGQRNLRVQKLNQLRQMGIDPFPAKSYKQYSNKEIVEKFSIFENKKVVLAGRITAWRGHGKLSFMDLTDDSGKVQVYIKQDELKATDVTDSAIQFLGFGDLALLDMHDYIEVTGIVVKTQRGEISIEASKIRILSKTIRPLPEELTDKEERFRRRYVDMKVNPEIKERMKRRALFWEAHREFFNTRGFYEVNIPVLEHVPGGGDAVPFTTHMNAIDQDFFLRISHELPLKRLIGAGFEKVYDIGARFRNEGLSDEHLPEHVAMEFYWAYADWKDGMKIIQELFTHIITRVYNGQMQFKIREFNVDFSKQWEIIDFNTIFQKTYGVKDIYNITIKEVKGLLQKNEIKFDRSINIARGVDALWKKIRKTIGGPAFLINHPKYLSPLQKASLDNPNMVERFQPIIAGSELGNGWSEVNDPIDQYERFLDQQKLRDSGDAEAQWLDIDYVEMLEYGMPPTFGYGHAERDFWFLENVTAREGVPFPQLKLHYDKTTQEIYPEAFEIVESLKAHVDGGNSNNTISELIPENDKLGSLVEDLNKTTDFNNLPTREEALKLLSEHVKDDYQILHAKMVGAAMEAWAKKLALIDNAINPDLWYLTGLLHDLDYYEYPNEHPAKSLSWFKEWEYPQELIHAVEAHALGFNGFETKPQSKIAAALMACDELSGFIYAYSLMRPTKLEGMDVKGVEKRLKDKGFAAKINRSDIEFGVNEFGVDRSEHIALLIEAFRRMDI